MTKKKKLGILATALSLVVCVALCGLLWWEMTKPERIEIPVPGLSWGMSAAEVEALLADAGLENAKVQHNGGMEDVYSVTLNAEEVQKLGFAKVGSLPVSYRENKPLRLEFERVAGLHRLTEVTVMVEVPVGDGLSSLNVEKAVDKALNALYGPKHEMGGWIIFADVLKDHPMMYAYSPWVFAQNYDTSVGEARLVYDAKEYVNAIYNGAYPAGK